MLWIINAMSYLSRNLKYLLFIKGSKPDDWAVDLSTVLKLDIEKAQGLLSGEVDTLAGADKEGLEQLTPVFPLRLSGEPLWEELDDDERFRLNLLYLLESLPHGEQKQLADTLGVDAATISRWKSGKQSPNRKRLSALVDYLNLPKDSDLRKELLFLSDRPVGTAETKKWLMEQIEALESKELSELMPAFYKLLR